MKQILFIAFAMCLYASTVHGTCVEAGIGGPRIDSRGYSGWTSDAVPVAYIASGDGCANKTNSTNPMDLCTTPHVIGQATCADQTWSEHDLDISTTKIGGYCWCRRTHVRVDDQLMSDIGPWYMLRANDADWCTNNCARQCSRQLDTNGKVAGQIVFLPRY